MRVVLPSPAKSKATILAGGKHCKFAPDENARRHSSRPARKCLGRDLLDAQVRQHFGLGFLHRQQIVADGAVLRNG